jgi:hypothetical protein
MLKLRNPDLIQLFYFVDEKMKPQSHDFLQIPKKVLVGATVPLS